MKYNTTYTPKVNLRETMIFTDYVKNRVIDFFSKQSKMLINVLAPSIYPEENMFNKELEKVTRAITFDAIDDFRVNQLALSDTPYLRGIMQRLGLENKQAIWSENNFIWRDLPETPVSTIVKYETTFQMIFEDLQSVHNMAANLYDLFYSLAQYAFKKYGVNNIFPPYAMFITSQMLENEFYGKEKREREIEMIMEKDAFIFENPSKKTLTGHIHTEIPLSLYHEENFYQVILRDRINSTVLKVASIAQVATGSQLGKQISNDIVLKQQDEFISLTKFEKNILEIKVNIPRLVMALLGKGHVAEVQPGVYNNEEKTIKTRYKVETY